MIESGQTGRIWSRYKRSRRADCLGTGISHLGLETVLGVFAVLGAAIVLAAVIAAAEILLR